MKAKKLVSLLLTVLIVVSCIPLSATAAGSDPKVKIELKSTGTFGSMTVASVNPDEEDEDKTYATLEDYMKIGVEALSGGYSIQTGAKYNAAALNTDSDGNGIADILEPYAGIASTAAKNSTVNKGDPVYVTVKISSENIENGILPDSLVISYDGNVFNGPADGEKIAVNALNKSATVKGGRQHTQTATGKTFGSNLVDTVKTSKFVINNESDPNHGRSVVSFILDYGTAGFMVPHPTGPDWDIIIPFEAKAAATNSEIAVALAFSSDNGTNTGDTSFWVPKAPMDGSQKVESTACDGYTGTANPTMFDLVSTFVTVESSDPAVTLTESKIDPKVGAELNLTLTNTDFDSGAAKAQFAVYDATDTGFVTPINDVVTGVTVDPNNSKKAKLTVDASSLDAAKNYKIKVLKEATTQASEGAVDIVTDGTFTVKKTLDIAVELDNETPTYGDTVTASVGTWTTPDADPGTGVSYQWYRDGQTAQPVSSDFTAISGATNAAYKAEKADVGNNLKCVVTVDGYYSATEAAATTTAVVAKKEVTLPAAFEVASASKGGSTTVTGEKAITGGVLSDDTVTGEYTAIYSDTSSANDSVTGLTATFTGIKAPMDAYYKLPTPATVASCTGKVTDKGYKLTVASSDSKDTPTFDATEYAGGTVETITITNLQDYEQLDTVTVNSVSAGSKDDITIKVTGRDTFTISTADAATAAIDVTLDITVKPNVNTVKKSHITISHTKPYDSTTAAENVTPTIDTSIKFTDGKSNVTLTGDWTYKTAAGGEKTLVGKNLQLGGDADQGYYVLGDDLKGEVEFTVTGGITAAAITGLEGTPVTTTNNDQAAVVEALQGSVITANGLVNAEGTLSEVLTMTEDEWKTLADDLLIENNFVKHEEVTVDLSAVPTPSTASVTAKKGGVLTFTLAEGDTLELTAATGYTLNNGKIEIAKDAVAGDLTLTVKHLDDDSGPVADTTVTLTVTLEDAEADYDAATGESFDVTIDAATINAKASDALKKNFSDTGSTTETIEINLTVNKQTTPPAPSGGFGVSFDAKGYGTPDSSYIQTDTDGKITELPKISNVVKGAVFLGWSTDGTKAHIIDPETYVVKEDIKLVAVYEGYMAGYGDGKVQPKKQVTRAELLKMLLVASGMYDASKDYGKPSFSDAKNHWVANYLACAEQSGKTIVEGYPDGTFKPNQPVTRQEAAKMIAETFGVKTTDGATTDKVTDFDKLQDWAKKYVAALCDNGTIDGFEDNTFRGKANIQRDQAAKMSNIYLGLDDEAKDSIKADTDIKSPFTDLTSKDNWAYADIIFASLSAPSSYYNTEIVVPDAK